SCVAPTACRRRVRAWVVVDNAASVAGSSPPRQRRLSVEIRLKLYQAPIAPEILTPLLAAWRTQRAASGQPGVARSSALIEDRAGANFAGQFESFLGLTDEAEFLTAVRACWAALWTTNARRYMEMYGLSPAD